MPNGLMGIFPDFAMTRSSAVIHLAVIGYPERLARFAARLAEVSKGGIVLLPLRSMPIRGDRRGSRGERLPQEVGVATALACDEIDQRTAVIRLGLSGQVALRRMLVRNGWLATWPARSRAVTCYRYL